MTSSSPGSYAPPAARTLLANRNFILLWLAYGVSALGDHLSELALLKVVGFEYSPQQTRLQAAMTFVFFLPFFLLSPVMGTLADRWPRRHMMILADLIRAGIVAGIPLLIRTAEHPLVVLLTPLLLLGVFAALFSPARLAILPTLVADEHLTRANSLINGLGTIAAMISYGLGGWLAMRDPYLNFRLDAATFLFSALCVLLIVEPRAVSPARRREPFAAALAAGWRYVRTHRRCVHLIIFSTVFWIAAAAFNSTLGTIVFHWYGADYEAFGYLKAAIGAGMLLGALLLSYFGEALRSEWTITWSLVWAGVALLGFLLTDSLAGGIVLTATVGMFGAALLIAVNTLLQRITPDYIRGRVFGLKDVVSMAGLLLATGVLGLAEIPGLDAAVGWLLGGLGVSLIGVGITSLVLRLRESDLNFEMSIYRNLNRFYCAWWFRLKRIGPCTVPPTGPVIVASNHTSSIDPLLLNAAMPRRFVGFLIARRYYNIPVFGRFIRMVGCVPVERTGRDLPALRAALRCLKGGGVLGVFPEGTIPRPGQKLPPKPGAALLALRSDAALVPVHISGTRYSDSVVLPFFMRHRARVRFGRPIDLGPYRSRPHDRRTVEELTAELWARIEALGPGREDGGPREAPAGA